MTTNVFGSKRKAVVKTHDEDTYKESIRSSSSFNQRLLKDRKFRLPFLDSQTRVAQNDCYLWFEKNDRIPSDIQGQLFSYPSSRWRKKRRQYLLDDDYLLSRTSAPTNSSAISIPTEITIQQPHQEKLIEPHVVSATPVVVNIPPNTPAVSLATPVHTTNTTTATTNDILNQNNDSSFMHDTSSCSNISQSGKGEFDGTLSESGATTSGTGPINTATSANLNLNSNDSTDEGTVDTNPYCDFCLGNAKKNKKTNKPEELVSCADCGRSGHPSCLNFSTNMLLSVKNYKWQCIECKSCGLCGTSDNDEQLLFCDDCDRGYHMYCLNPPLAKPPEGSWSCALCIEIYHKK